jgi:hypothetical protein
VPSQIALEVQGLGGVGRVAARALLRSSLRRDCLPIGLRVPTGCEGACSQAAPPNGGRLTFGLRHVYGFATMRLSVGTAMPAGSLASK